MPLSELLSTEETESVRGDKTQSRNNHVPAVLKCADCHDIETQHRRNRIFRSLSALVVANNKKPGFFGSYKDITTYSLSECTDLFCGGNSASKATHIAFVFDLQTQPNSAFTPLLMDAESYVYSSAIQIVTHLFRGRAPSSMFR